MIRFVSTMLGIGLFFGATAGFAQSKSDARFRVGARHPRRPVA